MLQNFGTALSRQQMKMVTGGAGYSVSCATKPGYHLAAYGSCTGSARYCQGQANSYCSSTVGCQSCSISIQ